MHKFLDPRLGLPLWLQTPCVGETLWAYSYEHIAALERFIGATLRGDPHIRTHRSMPQKLPRWMQLAKHRDAVRDGLQRLAQR